MNFILKQEVVYNKLLSLQSDIADFDISNNDLCQIK